MDGFFCHAKAPEGLSRHHHHLVRTAQVPVIHRGVPQKPVVDRPNLVLVNPAGEQRHVRALPAEQMEKLESAPVAILQPFQLLEEHDAVGCAVAKQQRPIGKWLTLQRCRDQRYHRCDAGSNRDGHSPTRTRGIDIDGEITDRRHHVEHIAGLEISGCVGAEGPSGESLDTHTQLVRVGVGADRIRPADVLVSDEGSDGYMLSGQIGEGLR